MNFPYKAVLFDWAYTLVDLVNEEDRTALRRVYDHLEEREFVLPGFQQWYDTYHRLFFGMIEVSRPTHREARFDHVLNFLLIQSNIHLNGKVRFEDLLKLYYDEIYSHRKVYPEMIETLVALQKAGIRMGVVSNTTNPGFMKDYEQSLLKLDPYFEFSIYSSEVPYRKPHPSIFQLALARLNLDPAEVLFVGDNLNADVVGAQSVGMPTAWLNREGKDLPSDVIPDYEIKTATELLTLPTQS
ncbi:MAG: HAD family hydrolase [Nitrospinaceae bacterium]|jgi:HAD superfamily hydrolase (TIGR01662 family)